MRVLIAEQSREFRRTIVTLITVRHEMTVARDTGDALQFVAHLDALRWDLVFIDLKLPGLFRCLDVKTLRNDYPATRFIVIGDGNDDDIVTICHLAGFDGYLSRSGDLEQLARSVIRISMADSWADTSGAILDGRQADRAPARREGEATEHSLTARQTDVLSLLAEGRSTKDIARRLGLAVPTVKTHLAAVYRQLGARNRVEAVVKARSRPASSAMSAMFQPLGGLDDYHRRSLAAG